MLNNSQFSSALPLGFTAQSPVKLPEPQWVRRGRTLARSAYARLSPLFPIGKLTATARTLAAIPSGLSVIATATHFVAAGANTANAIQYSTDGASWSTAATAAASTVSALGATPSRIIAFSSGANQPIYSASASPSSVWAATTSGPTNVAAGNSFCRLSYSASLGRVLGCSGSAVYTLDDGATAWVTRTVTASSTRMGGCWTGSKFLAISHTSAVLNSSSDSITWADSTLPEATAASQGNIASDGAGTVVASGFASGLYLSKDHGVNWSRVDIPGAPVSDAWRVQFSDGRFFVPTAVGLAMSQDGENWYIDNALPQAFATAAGIAKKGSVSVQLYGSTTAANSFAESATEFLVPDQRIYYPVASGNPIPGDPTYIKAL